MKDVPGWKTGTWYYFFGNISYIFLSFRYGEPVYFTLGDKWWDPTLIEFFAHSPRKAQKDEVLFQQHSEYSAPKFYDKWIPETLGKYIW